MIPIEDILKNLKKLQSKLLHKSLESMDDDLYAIAVSLRSSIKLLEDYYNAALKTQRWK